MQTPQCFVSYNTKMNACHHKLYFVLNRHLQFAANDVILNLENTYDVILNLIFHHFEFMMCRQTDALAYSEQNVYKLQRT